MKPLRFWKYCAAGNDFLLLESRNRRTADSSRLARLMCRRHFGVGADGMLEVAPDPAGGGVIHLDYFNADGSLAAFCGNGARCGAHFAWWRKMSPPEMILDFGTYRVQARVEGQTVQTVRLTLPPAEWEIPPIRVTLEGEAESFEGEVVRAGVGHAVFPVHAIENVDLEALAGALRQIGESSERASLNVTLVEVEGDGVLRVRTHERGCGETLACGSAAAAAGAWAERRGEGNAWSILPPAGIPLEVRVEEDGRVRLSGDAQLLFEGRWPPEDP